MRARSSLLVLALALAGCTAAPEPAGADEYAVDCESGDGGQPVVSDENWTKFVEAETGKTVKADACKSPEITAPSAGTTLDPNAPPTFAFHPSHATCRLDRRPPSFGPCHARESWGVRLLDTVLLIGTAEAHCAAISGENYYLKLTHDGDAAPVYTAMLSVTSFTPDAAKWKAALGAHAGETLLLTITRGVFTKGDLTDGPFVQTAPVALTVAK